MVKENENLQLREELLAKIRELGKAKNEFKKGLAEGEKESVEAEKAEDAKPEPAKELV